MRHREDPPSELRNTTEKDLRLLVGETSKNYEQIGKRYTLIGRQPQPTTQRQFVSNEIIGLGRCDGCRAAA